MCGNNVPWGKGREQELKLVLVYRPPDLPGSPSDGGNTARMCKALAKLDGSVVIVGDFKGD